MPQPGSLRELANPSEPGQGLCVFQSYGHQLYVDFDGTVVPCCAHPRAAELGSLKHHRLSEILASDTRRAFRTALAARTPDSGICATCAWGSSTTDALATRWD
jgi:radical SAM protein with 4Fe4S-binding SPASM domain